MTEYTEEELLGLERKEASEELSDEQLKRYNSLKAQQLEESVDDYKGDKAVENADGLDKLLSDAQDEMVETVEIYGNELEILVDPDEADFSEIKELKNKADVEEENLSEKEVSSLKNDMFNVIGQFTTEYDASDWKEKYDGRDVGLRTILEITYEILEQVESSLNQKKRR